MIKFSARLHGHVIQELFVLFRGSEIQMKANDAKVKRFLEEIRMIKVHQKNHSCSHIFLAVQNIALFLEK